MTLVQSIDNVVAWLAENVCPQISLTQDGGGEDLAGGSFGSKCRSDPRRKKEG